MNNSKNFALLGLAGYVAPRHLRAIKECEMQLISAYDPSDSVGIIDSFFPNAAFFTQQELFDRHNSKLCGTEQSIGWVSVCTPNYLHDAHCRYGLRLGADVICEKPLCLNPWNIDALHQIEQQTGHNIYNILQLRLHPSIVALKKVVDATPKEHRFQIDLTYITSRGNWYYTSWKGDEHKSGGVATNIGVHFFDMLLWLFGEVQNEDLHIATHDRYAGILHLQRADVRYFLSINRDTLPEDAQKRGDTTLRTLEIDGQNVEFSSGFTDLHTASYREVFAGNGFRLEDVRPAIALVHRLRTEQPIGLKGDYHPLARLPLAPHPFGWQR